MVRFVSVHFMRDHADRMVGENVCVLNKLYIRFSWFFLFLIIVVDLVHVDSFDNLAPRCKTFV